MITALIAIAALGIGGLLGAFFYHRLDKKYKMYGGTIVIDLSNDAVNTMEVHGPRDISDWIKNKYIIFDVKVRG